MTIILGLLGPAGAGKSTVAAYLAERYGARRYSLATPLKEIASRALDFSYEQLYGHQSVKEAIDPRYGFSPRWFLQRLGTEGMRHVFGPDVWVDHLLAKIEAERPYLATIEDVRFVNEAENIRARGPELRAKWRDNSRSFVWRLENPERESAADAGHQSEAEWSRAPYDFTIAPIGKGLDLFYRLLDDGCRTHGLPLVEKENS